MLVHLITKPASEPVTLTEAKAHLRLEHALDDAYVSALIVAARQWAEEYCWRGFVTQTWETVLEGFPCGDEIPLSKGNLSSLVSVTYIDANGAAQTLSFNEILDVVVDAVSEPGRVLLGYGKSWPTTRDQWDAVRIRYVVGWPVADVPVPIKQAILLLVSHLYEQRSPEIVGTIVSPVQFAVEALLGPYRLRRFS